MTRILRHACAAAEISVVECHRPLWQHTRDKTRAYFSPTSLFRLAVRYLQIGASLAREWRRQRAPAPVALVGFNGQLDVLLLRWLAGRRYPIVLAPLVTITETLVDDRRQFPPRSLRATLVRQLDRLSLQSATRVVIDTEAHRRYLHSQLAIDPEHTVTWYLGTDVAAFPSRPLGSRARSDCRVLFYGQFLPLHGIETIVRAAERLRDQPRITFRIIGAGPERAACLALARQLRLDSVEFIEWVRYERLADELADADIVLGIFGTSAKAQMVIPNKVYQAASVGCAIISADSPAIREVFVDGETIRLTPAGNAAALAEAIRGLAADQAQRERMARHAQTLMHDRFSPAQQGDRLVTVFADALAAAQ
ncbi:MAG: glycosyltransferase [Deltaproteobacteria bacterium]|nr:glycosyltransferase [Deltaproteobacteria bacterium]MBI3390807.1 glycosyltransferase [Deltaproteobacteria bacterium]